jgi:hypothetical protein
LTGSPPLFIYERIGDSFKLLPSPDDLPSGGSNCCAFSPDNLILATGPSSTNNTLFLYTINGNKFIKIAVPSSANLPQGHPDDMAFSNDGEFLAVASANSPYITIYRRNGLTFTKIANPPTLPTSAAKGVVFSPDSQMLVVTLNNSPLIRVYKREGNSFVDVPNPEILPSASARGVAFSNDGKLLVIATITIPMVYRVDGNEFTHVPGGIAGAPSFSIHMKFSKDGTIFGMTSGNAPRVIGFQIENEYGVEKISDINEAGVRLSERLLLGFGHALETVKAGEQTTVGLFLD